MKIVKNLELFERAEGKFNLFNEQLVAFHDVAKLFPPTCRGKTLSLKTIYRWSQKGTKGVRLERLKTPTGFVTSVEAVERFIAKINAHAGESQCIANSRRAISRKNAWREVSAALKLDRSSRQEVRS